MHACVLVVYVVLHAATLQCGFSKKREQIHFRGVGSELGRGRGPKILWKAVVRLQHVQKGKTISRQGEGEGEERKRRSRENAGPEWNVECTQLPPHPPLATHHHPIPSPQMPRQAVLRSRAPRGQTPLKSSTQQEHAHNLAKQSPQHARSGLSTLLSDNPAKAAGERYFLAFAAYWVTLMAVVVGTQAFEWFSPEQYLAVGVAIVVPCVVYPLLFPLEAEAHQSVWERYTTKNNVWVAIVTFYALWVWQIYFYVVLCTRYTFSVGVLRINNVPVTLFLITQGYFSLYHTLSDIVVRAYHRRFGRPGSLMGWCAFVVALFAFCYSVAFMETLTIQHFPHYDIYDRHAMYVYGSVFYALYFIWTFPAHAGLDEVSLRSCAIMHATHACIVHGPHVQARMDTGCCRHVDDEADGDERSGCLRAGHDLTGIVARCHRAHRGAVSFRGSPQPHHALHPMKQHTKINSGQPPNCLVSPT